MSLKDGLTKKEGFTPEASSPPETGKSCCRPKHDNPKVKRKGASKKGM